MYILLNLFVSLCVFYLYKLLLEVAAQASDLSAEKASERRISINVRSSITASQVHNLSHKARFSYQSALIDRI